MTKPKDRHPEQIDGSTQSRAGRAPPSPSLVEAGATSDQAAAPASFPVVGIGASAGGLEALNRLFGRLPANSGIAFVVVQHLDPQRPSMLTSVLEGITQVPVVEATDGMPAQPNRVHVIPSGSDISIQRGILWLAPRQLTGRLHLPIDSFFGSLAEDRRNRAIGVLLSGSGADGTEGLRAIKSEGGFAIAQEPSSARFGAMPESALAAGVVDFRGTPEEIAGELERLSRHPYVVVSNHVEGEPREPVPDPETSLTAVFALVRQEAGIDFSGYKRTTVLRRIERRMALRRIAGFDEYAAVLHDEPAETAALARDMLIHVTSFFRDPDAFTELEQRVFTRLAQEKGDGDSIRIWVPGCSTGEEVYALAIGLLESLGTGTESLVIKLFGTDLSEEAIEAARIGCYSETAVAGVSPDRLSRFFARSESGYQIAKRIRDLCVFVKHDLTRDPPFAKLDLISCRNVLIYFDAELQRRVIPMLHHCLNKQGCLFLGHSETIGGFRDLFAPVDKAHRIFVKTGESRSLVYPLPAGREVEGKLSESKLAARRYPVREAQRQADHLLLARFAPPGVLVNDRLEVVQFRGRTGAFLEHPPGQPQANLLRMAREDLVAHVHEAVASARAQSTAVRKEGLRIQAGDETRLVDLEVVPLAVIPHDSTERYFLVLFAEHPTRAGAGERQAPRQAELEPATEGVAEVDRLKAELVATKDYLQSLISEHQTTTDELAATNEEMVAANEELQSTNEELQSAKEELQSTNEELGTVNDQLRSRNQDLDQVASDLVNVLSSVEVPVIIVDLELRVRRFTPSISEIAGFIPEDLGRPIDDLKLKIRVEDLPRRIKDVIGDMSPKEWEVQRQDGRWFRMHIRPYRALDQRLDGAVIAFVDVDVLKQTQAEAERARDYARSIVETVTTALVVLDSDLRVLSANAAFLQMFSLSTRIEGKPLFDLRADLWKLPAIREILQDSLTKHCEFSDFEVTTELPQAGRRVFFLAGRPIERDRGQSMMLLAIDDVTDLRTLEAERTLLLASEKQARLEAERANHAKDHFLATLSHELRTPLSTVLMSAHLLKQLATGDRRIARASASIERATQAQSKLIDDLLDVSRIVSGKLLLDLGPVDWEAVVQGAVDIAQPAAQAKSLELELSVDGAIGTVYGDELRLQQVVNNLLVNAIKFTPHGGRVAVRLEREDGDQALLTVTDTGMGIRPEVLPQLFNRFVQADSSVTRTHGGLGLGLSIVRHLVEAHGGSVQVESPGEGKGATFRVTLPLGGADASDFAPTLQASARGIAGVRVLLVEDDDDTREAYAAMLTELGAEVRAAPSAAAAFQALEESPPQVILSDIAMPGEHGLSFIQRVRRLAPEQGGHLPAAALTALTSNEERQKALEAGFQMHVQKPIDAAQLISIVSTLVAWPQPPKM